MDLPDFSKPSKRPARESNMSNTNDDAGVETMEGEIISPMNALTVYSQEMDVQIVTAKRFPRRKDKDIAIRITDRATLSPDIAAECLYNLPRDGKTITGPSIRFAEIVRSCYGNIRVASRFVRIDKDDTNRQAVIVEAVAYDVENNDSESSQIRRSIMTSGKGGQIPRPYSVDMIATTVMAAQAIARRNAILALVPKALYIDAQHKVLEVVRGQAETLGERRTKMLQAFKQYGVEPADLFRALEIDSEQEISLNDMPRLAGMWTALKEGEAPESVLGREIEKRPGHRTVRNPMDDAPSTDQGQATYTADTSQSRQGPAGEPERKDPPRIRQSRKSAQATATSEPERDRQAEAEQEGREVADPTAKPAASQAAGGAPVGTTGTTSQQTTASSASQASTTLDPFAEGLKFLNEFQGNAGELVTWWRSPVSRKLRESLSFEQQGDFSKHYNAKLVSLGQ